MNTVENLIIDILEAHEKFGSGAQMTLKVEDLHNLVVKFRRMREIEILKDESIEAKKYLIQLLKEKIETLEDIVNQLSK